MMKRLSASDIQAQKGSGPLVALTAYSVMMAKWLDDYTDLLLVGDSLGMVLYGMENTLGVSLDMMIAHGKAVMRGSSRSCVVVDMPFGTYQESPGQAFRHGARVLRETQCSGIKIEGGAAMAETIYFLTTRGIPVLSHIGLCPQSIKVDGRFHDHGGNARDDERLLDDARAVTDAGAFALVLESMVEPLARKITNAITIPTIGIGASPACDGQILVTEDVVGLFDAFRPKFAKKYEDLAPLIKRAAKAYHDDVRARRFPTVSGCSREEK